LSFSSWSECPTRDLLFYPSRSIFQEEKNILDDTDDR
jgi:hypothetical protein